MPSEKLRASRERLRETMRSYSAPRRDSMLHEHNSQSNLLDALKSIPGASIVVDAIVSWWAQHPLHSAGLMAAGAAKVMVKPMAERNPFALMLAMVFIGGLLVWKRPWRWLLTPALFVGLLPQLIAKFAQQMPIETWLAAFDRRPHEMKPQQTRPQATPSPETRSFTASANGASANGASADSGAASAARLH